MPETEAPSQPVFVPIGDTRTRADLVIESIRTAILSGRLKPGETLVERKIGEELNVSKTPVREALIALTRSGLIEMTRNRGAAVAHITLTDMQHIYEQRLLLEPWAVRSAVLAPGAEFFAAERALLEAKEAGAKEDLVSSALANRRFHRALYAPCPNHYVTSSLDQLQDLAALATATYLWDRWPTWSAEAVDHSSILNCVTEGDAEGASKLVHEHIAASLTRLRARGEDVE